MNTWKACLVVVGKFFFLNSFIDITSQTVNIRKEKQLNLFSN